MDLFMHLVRSLDSSPLSLIWFVLLIDCLVNTNLKGPQKFWWLLFMVITQFFGAVLYFFLGPAQIYRHIAKKINQQHQSSNNASTWQPNQQRYPPVRQGSYAPEPMSSSPTAPPRTQQDSVNYQQGYRAQERVTPVATQEPSYSDPLYEQPQAIYPEMTQEQ